MPAGLIQKISFEEFIICILLTETKQTQNYCLLYRKYESQQHVYLLSLEVTESQSMRRCGRTG